MLLVVVVMVMIVVIIIVVVIMISMLLLLAATTVCASLPAPTAPTMLCRRSLARPRQVDETGIPSPVWLFPPAPSARHGYFCAEAPPSGGLRSSDRKTHVVVLPAGAGGREAGGGRCKTNPDMK